MTESPSFTTSISIALFLAKFIRDFENQLDGDESDFHLINFHSRIYHEILQNIDQLSSANQEAQTLPRSLTMSIGEFSEILPSVEKDVFSHWDYNHECHHLIRRFFRLLSKQIAKALAQSNETTNIANAKTTNQSKDTSTPNGHAVDFGPYTRRHHLRDDDPRQLEKEGKLQFNMIYNDSTQCNWKLLIYLKEIFHECLPSMPPTYITRIIFNKKHRSIIAKMTDSGDVFGGVCFRPFPERNFAEVVFLAITPNHQIKGFGSRLMNHLKENLKRMGIYHIVTFADNNAIGYFAKQGFKLTPLNAEGKIDCGAQTELDQEIDGLYGCTNLNLQEIVATKYIKIYNSAKLMHSRIIQQVNYCNLNEHLLANRKLLVGKIGKISRSVQRREGQLTSEQLKQIGKTKTNLHNGTVSRELMEVTARISGILKLLRKHSKVTVFDAPVEESQAGDYYNVIKRPMDLSKIQKKLDRYQYRSVQQFRADFKQIVINCKLYNPKNNPYHNFAVQFDEYFEELMKKY